MKKVTKNQLSLLHVAKAQLGLSDQDWRDLLMRVEGIGSSKDLHQYGFDRVLGELEQLGFKNTATTDSFGSRRGMATPAQVHFLRDLWRDYTDGKGDDASLGRWLQRYSKVSALRFVDAATAAKAIPALKAMVERKRRVRRSASPPAA